MTRVQQIACGTALLAVGVVSAAAQELGSAPPAEPVAVTAEPVPKPAISLSAEDAKRMREDAARMREDAARMRAGVERLRGQDPAGTTAAEARQAPERPGGVRRTILVPRPAVTNASQQFRFDDVTDRSADVRQPRNLEQRRSAVESFRRSLQR